MLVLGGFRRLLSASLQVCLVIYAPRKGVCDVYATRHGPVLHSLQCGANCRCDDSAKALCLSVCVMRTQSVKRMQVAAAGCCSRRQPWAGQAAPPFPQTASCWTLMLAQPRPSGGSWVATLDALQRKVTALNEQHWQRLQDSMQVCRQSSGHDCA